MNGKSMPFIFLFSFIGLPCQLIQVVNKLMSQPLMAI